MNVFAIQDMNSRELNALISMSAFTTDAHQFIIASTLLVVISVIALKVLLITLLPRKVSLQMSKSILDSNF